MCYQASVLDIEKHPRSNVGQENTGSYISHNAIKRIKTQTPVIPPDGVSENESIIWTLQKTTKNPDDIIILYHISDSVFTEIPL